MTARKTSDISVIVPTLNDASSLDRLLAGLRGSPGLEIIVADGGSQDGTAAVARRHGVGLTAATPGRGSQLNHGLRRSSGEYLVFLHCDTLLPADFAAHVRATLSRPGTAAGAFRLAIDARGAQYRLIEWGANFRSGRLGLPYGDQAIFARREVVQSVGGVPEDAILEDVDLVRRLRRAGRIRLAPAAVLTSARRWEHLGVLRTTLLNQAMLAGYLLNIDRDRLHRFYYRQNHRRPPP
ncbi:MAG: TIGR04283 family arsenosugar biosynthesis glycosyltransferase [Desulfobulbaceae bacterium]